MQPSSCSHYAQHLSCNLSLFIYSPKPHDINEITIHNLNSLKLEGEAKVTDCAEVVCEFLLINQLVRVHILVTSTVNGTRNRSIYTKHTPSVTNDQHSISLILYTTGLLNQLEIGNLKWLFREKVMAFWTYFVKLIFY